MGNTKVFFFFSREGLIYPFTYCIIVLNTEGGVAMISTKGRYAIRVMIDLAENGREGCVPLKDIAARQQLSRKYLEIIVKDLVSGGLLEGISGKGGGYRLVRKPEEYTVGEIIELTEGSLTAVACLADGAAPCPRASTCQTIPLWAEYDKLTHDFFYGKRLTDLLNKDQDRRTQ